VTPASTARRGLLRRGNRRRGGVLVVLLTLVFLGAAYAAIAPTPRADADTSDPQLVAQGKRLFEVSCASCHGVAGEGVNASGRNDTSYGPSLLGVGAAAVDFQVGTGRMPLMQAGPEAVRKPPSMTPDETRALAAYVATFQPGPAIPTDEEVNPAGVSDADLAEGGELFRTNCAGCHNFIGRGGPLPDGRVAPPLQGVEPVNMFEAMLTGPQQMPVFSNQVLTPEDKRNIIAYLKHIEKQPSTGGLTLGALGPVTEGLWAWIAGVGGCVVIAIWLAAKGTRSR
jgi:ubiquinol-cytochrome c reductase cytochrome c subunit